MVNASDNEWSATGRSSWGAIFAGVVIAIVVSLVLGMLGLAIGMAIIEPTDKDTPVMAISIGSGIYAAISGIIALFAGGYVTGALSADQHKQAPVLHGLTTWGVVTLLNFALITGITGGLVSGAGKVVATGLETMAGASGALARPVVEEVSERLQEADMDLDLAELRREAREILRQMDPSLQPEQLEEDVEELAQRAEEAVRQVARDPQSANEAVQDVFDRIQAKMQDKISATDREALVNILVTRTEMSEAEAQQAINEWQQIYQQAYEDARTELAEMREQAEQRAREYSDAVADAVSAAAWWAFFMLILDAIAAVIGARSGARRIS
ncbi:hypothetical protein CWI75_10945 [Kineobactrum sediminis]|uniref:CAP-Gly protein n=1 Tax=Kineobactrum sediminis TaxID=1905677 RepID=A0A2N5Y1L4_9GAMM|nr:hypothetical protein [Kineobactrum sediminis]PLW82285.1 hypothetical protein CWI75_10945 [Kineobactrum sediminis]